MSGYFKELKADCNLTLEEKFMISILKDKVEEHNNFAEISYDELMIALNTKRAAKISKILKSLKEKSYIVVEKIIGRNNRYYLIKDYLVKSYESRNSKNRSSENIGTDNCDIFDNKNYEFSDGSSENRNSDLGNYTSKNRSAENSKSYEDKDNNINNNYINNTSNKNNYNNIINHWNSKEINGEVLNSKIVESINIATREYSFDEIKKAIDNYSRIYYSDHYYNFKWTLSAFLSRPKGISKFTENGQLWLDYKKDYFSLSDQMEEVGLSMEDFID